ncbi:MAG: hypothetical protein EXR80_04525 [Methylococcales bacterium]|nr:hypothetical protein [Methylococcales bacterium]
MKGSKENVPIYQDGAEFGVGNENKAMMIPTLQSRRLSKISIKPADMGLNKVADHDEPVIDVGVRSASVVEFTLGKFVAVEGYAYTVVRMEANNI